MEFFKENIHLGEVLVQLIAFVIVFWTLKILAWKPLLAALETRRQRIAQEYAQIESSKKEIETLKSQYSAHLQKIEDQARSKILEAVEEGRKISKEIQDKARTESHQTLEKAKENLELQIQKARLTLREEIAHLAITATERILQEKMSQDAAQQSKILDIINDLEKSR